MQYGIIRVLWDTDSFLLLSREEQSLVAQASTQCGNTGLQKFAANLYIITFRMQLYIDITVTCTCVSILAFFQASSGLNMFFFSIQGL